jgi:Uncharacterised protein family (UPF0139)
VALKRFLLVATVAVATAALTYALRSFLIEPRTLHDQCVLEPASLLCMTRQTLIMGFVLNVYSLASLVLGVLGLMLKSRSCAWAAIVLGVIGAMLYRIEFAALGLLFGALAVARPPIAPQHGQSH